MTTKTKNNPDPSIRKIMLIDDHPVVREGFARIINDEKDLEVCAQFDNAKTVLKAITTNTPDLVVIDMSLEDTTGLELIKNIRTQHEDLPLLVLSMYDELLYAERVLRAGANGYVMKRSPAESVIEAIRTVLNGDLWLGPSVRDRILRGSVRKTKMDVSDIEALSDREFEVLQLLGEGLKSREIAEKLCISPKTVDTYRSKLKEKLQLENGTELSRYAVHWYMNAEKKKSAFKTSP